jgi:hypothetical protein
MKPRDFLNFFKTRSGKIVAFGALFAAVLLVFSVVRKRHTSAEDNVPATPPSTNSVSEKPQVVQSVVRSIENYYPPTPKQDAPTSSPVSGAGTQSNSRSTLPAPAQPPQPPSVSPTALAVAAPRQAEPLAPISLFADDVPGAPKPKKLSPLYAPFGRLIPCETVITVDSSSIETPIVGLVTENVYFGGKVIIPAGTEVHGMAQTDRQRDRISTSGSWTLVLQDGDEMQLKAVALDREFDNNTNQTGWSITDGSAGLRGEVLKTDDYADLKLFAATFLSGAASALTVQQQTALGPINSPTLANAPFAGAQTVLQNYAQQVLDSIEKNGYYVRVASGKQFYLYVLQTIDVADESLGGTAIPVASDNAQPTTTPKSKP